MRGHQRWNRNRWTGNAGSRSLLRARRRYYRACMSVRGPPFVANSVRPDDISQEIWSGRTRFYPDTFFHDNLFRTLFFRPGHFFPEKKCPAGHFFTRTLFFVTDPCSDVSSHRVLQQRLAILDELYKRANLANARILRWPDHLVAHSSVQLKLTCV